VRIGGILTAFSRDSHGVVRMKTFDWRRVERVFSRKRLYRGVSAPHVRAFSPLAWGWTVFFGLVSLKPTVMKYSLTWAPSQIPRRPGVPPTPSRINNPNGFCVEKLMRRIHRGPGTAPHPRLRYKAHAPTRRCSHRGTHDVDYRCRGSGSAGGRCRHCGGGRLDVRTPASIAIRCGGSQFPG
jgi:hypothetical protein